MIKSLFFFLAASLLLAVPASAAAVPDQPVLLDVGPSHTELVLGCEQPLRATDMLFVEAREGCDPLMAELTGLCLVPAPAETRLVAFASPPAAGSSCSSIRASPD